MNPVSQKTMDELYEETQLKRQLLESQGYEYIEKWE